jgi:hypothetical protein
MSLLSEKQAQRLGNAEEKKKEVRIWDLGLRVEGLEFRV